MSITADLIRGHTDTIILSCLMEEDSYGYRINRKLLRLSDGTYELKEATLYTAFKRLEESGFITSYWGDESVGARRRYYAITASGRDEYRRRVAEWTQASEMISRLIGAVPHDSQPVRATKEKTI